MTSGKEDEGQVDVFAKLHTSYQGLSQEEASKRLKEYGPNMVTERKRNPLILFLLKFWAPVPWMLEITAILTYVLHKYLDMEIILFLLIFNSIISFMQEYRAENAVELLKRRLKVASKVKRNGKWALIPAEELVPGDVVSVRLGDIVPADVHIIDGIVLVDQSVLTGECLPVA